MSIISFDITYKKHIDKDSIKLSSEADFQQVKIIICGRYKLYDMNNIYIYYHGKNINPDEHMKLKNFFKTKKFRQKLKKHFQQKMKKFLDIIANVVIQQSIYVIYVTNIFVISVLI